MGKRENNEAAEELRAELSTKQLAFVAAYLENGFNATQAALKAGYSARTADQQGSRLLKNVKVAAAIQEALRTRGITPERVRIALAEIAFDGDLAEFEKFISGEKKLTDLRNEGANTKLVKSVAISQNQAGTNYRIELHDRLAALKELAQVLGMVTERHEHSGAVRTGPDLSALSPETKARVLQELGGPESRS